MKITRSINISINEMTDKKKKQLEVVFNEFCRLVNEYINFYYKNPKLPKYCEKSIISTFLSARLQQMAGKQALEIIKSTKKKQREKRYYRYKKVYTWCMKHNRFPNFTNKKYNELKLGYKLRPYFNGKTINIDSRICDIQRSNNSFDFWIHLSSLGNKLKLDIPYNSFRKLKEYNSWKRVNSFRLNKNNKGFYLTLIFEKEIELKQGDNSLGIDLGINSLISCSDEKQYGADFKYLLNKLFKKQQGSKKYNKMLNQIHNYIGYCVNQIDYEELDNIILENLKYIQTDTTNRVRNLGLIHQRIKNKCEINRVNLVFINPKNTSRACPICNTVDKKNRNKEQFRCVNCGYECNADINASKNILNLFYKEKNISSDIVPCSEKDNFIDFH